MPAKIDIIASLFGGARVEDGLRGISATAKAMAANVSKSTFSIGSGIGAMSPQIAAVDKQIAQMSGRREFMAGQRLQSTITSTLGIDNGLTRTIDGFERLSYMASASGMTMGQMFRTIGPGALSTAAAVGTVTMAWTAWNNEVAKTNAHLSGAGYKSIGTIDQIRQLFAGNLGITARGMEADPEKMYASIVAEVNKPNIQKQFEAFVEKNPTLSRERYIAEYKRLVAVEEEIKESELRFKERVAARERGRKGDEARLDPWFDLFGGMAKGGAKLPSAETYGSREYLAKQQEIQEAPRQTQLAEATLAVLERMLTEIRASNGAGNAVFSWP